MCHMVSLINMLPEIWDRDNLVKKQNKLWSLKPNNLTSNDENLKNNFYKGLLKNTELKPS
jgi:hypothetical protein